MVETKSTIKQPVPRDFRHQIFYMDQFPPSPLLYHEGNFKFFRKFTEIFAAQGAPPMSLLTPVANGKKSSIGKVFSCLILFLLFAPIVDIDGKFATGINNASRTGGKISRRCRCYWWCTLAFEYLCELKKK
jgi:hypothetical protein